MKQQNKLLKLIHTSIFIILCMSMYGQQKTVTGTISDDNGQPLPGATVLVKGTVNGTQSDFDGNFTIQATSNDILVFSYIGFSTKEVSVDSQSTISVTLNEDTAKLDEVVVIGYGKMSRASVTTSISKVDADELQNIPVASNAATALIGKVSGVTVAQTDGRPNATPKIWIRGGTGTNPAEDSPLFVVDGVVRTDMDDINISDISSFTIY